MKTISQYIKEQLIHEADDLLGGGDMGGGAAAPMGGASDFGGGGFGGGFGGGGAADGQPSANDKDVKRLRPEDGFELDKSDIKFTIWEENNKKVTKLKDNSKYLKIEYKYIDNKKGVKIDFLLGFVKKDVKSWCLWVGKIGSCNYSDEPYCKLGTESFDEAVILSLDKIVAFVHDVYEKPKDNVQYYIEK